ncbi:MAG: tRNA epoxyqueuosine(34) reductase QueG [candidate division Zixibacteria bacterium]|nr:tRNA epoxyqueuosine(34) reductase QueG [candidate division Zixibacteria bacterium]
MDKKELTKTIKRLAYQYGFDRVGISCAQELTEESVKLNQWLDAGMHGQMSYMKNHAGLRINPEALLPGAKSVISLTHNYYNPSPTPENSFKIARYAYGKDYHNVLHKKLKKLTSDISHQFSEIKFRNCADSAPIMEKAWAKRSGIGWQGKNGCIIAPKVGSFFFLATIITDADLDYDTPLKDHCGTCQECLDACPTGAITSPYVVDARKCISYLTTELKDKIPEEIKGKYRDWIFGCDICQDVCPHNRFSKPHDEDRFMPKDKLLAMTEAEWRKLSEDEFSELFAGTPIKRIKYEGLKKNIAFVDKEKP